MKQYINDYIKQEILDSLCEFIKIPNLSPQFINQDPYQDDASQHIYNWIKSQNIPNLKIDIIKQKEAAPLIFVEIPSNSNKTVLFYGHYDKQPYGEGWLKSPTHPYIENNKLFGRGGADDGYAIYTSIAIIKTCLYLTNNHPYCYMLFEGEEESGSTNFISYFDSLNLKPIDYIVTLDTGCDEDYNKLWITTSTRGSITVDVYAQDFQDLRIQLDKIEDSKTGKAMDDLYVPIPQQKLQEIEDVYLDIHYKFPYKCDKIIEDRITVFYVYQFDDAMKNYLTKPIEFLDSYINSKHKGGLYDYLITEKLITDMESQPFYGENGGFMFYLIVVIIEENQLKNIYKIQSGIVNYFKQINIDQLQDMYDNKKNMKNMQFKYMEEEQDIFQLSHNLNTYNPKYVLNGHEIFGIFNKKLILKYLKQLQNPKNMIVLVGHNKYKLFEQNNIELIEVDNKNIKFILNNHVNTNNKLYHLQYQIDNLKQETLDYLNSFDIQFVQPEINNYIPTNFKFKTLCNQQQISYLQYLNPETIYRRNEEEFIQEKQFVYYKTKKQCKEHEFEYEKMNLFPQLINKNLEGSLWWRLDRQFSPMIFVGLRFDSPVVIDTTKEQALLRLFNSYQVESLEISLQQSLEAGFSFDFDSSVRGLTLQLYGWSDRFQQFYQDILQTLKHSCNDQQLLNRVRKKLIQTYKNQAENKLYIQARNILKDMLENNPSSSEMIEELQTLNINDLVKFQDQVMNSFRINTLMTGNILRKEAQELEELIHQVFKENKPELSSHYHKTTVFSIGSQSIQFVMFSKSSNQQDNNGVTLNYYQIGSRDKKQYALMTLLQNPISEAAYSYLRTNLQLGYVVQFSFKPVGCIDAAQLLIQGTVEQPYIVNKKIEEFLILYGRQLQEMSNEEFEELKAMNIQKLKNPFTNLKDKASDIWWHVKNNDLAFEEKEIAISVIDTIKKEDLFEFYDQVFRGGKLSLQIYGKGMLDDLSKVNTLSKDETYATRNEINIDSIDGFHQKLRLRYNCNYRISNF